MYKKFVCSAAAGFLSLLLCFALFIGIVDPFLHYHKPLFGMHPHITTELNQNDGISKHLEYDSVLLGSSMAENFDCTWFNEAFDCQTVKLTFQAARAINYELMLENAFNTHSVKNVFICLDIDSFCSSYGEFFFPIPEYLYDDNIFNDVNYLLNKEVFFEYALPAVGANLQGTAQPNETAYSWSDDFTYSKESVFDTVYWDITDINDSQNNDMDFFTANAKENVEKALLRFIKEHPETKFYVFIPPYSIVWWNLTMHSGRLDTFSEILNLLSGSMLEYDNVEMYYFQNDEDIIYNLNNYKDYNHYSADINRFMLDKIAEKNEKYRMTKSNYKEKIETMRGIALNYDYAALLSD